MGELYLITYEWCSRSGEWHRENRAIVGCPGIWWAEWSERASKLGAGESYRFLCATPICVEAYELLKDKQ